VKAEEQMKETKKGAALVTKESEQGADRVGLFMAGSASAPPPIKREETIFNPT
jgi:hypothetical protein